MPMESVMAVDRQICDQPPLTNIPWLVVVREDTMTLEACGVRYSILEIHQMCYRVTCCTRSGHPTIWFAVCSQYDDFVGKSVALGQPRPVVHTLSKKSGCMFLLLWGLLEQGLLQRNHKKCLDCTFSSYTLS